LKREVGDTKEEVHLREIENIKLAQRVKELELENQGLRR
jgi:hypothetical protein